MLATELARLCAVLEAGGVVACPTETFVGLLADAASAAAIGRVIALKGRDPENPIGLLLPGPEALEAVAGGLSERARELAERHWPGPLTLVVEARPGLHPALQRDGKVGVRVPGASPALELVRAFGRPLTATSANKSGEPAARTASEVRRIFGEALDAVVPGESPGQLASTVVDVTGSEPKLLRRGAIELG